MVDVTVAGLFVGVGGGVRVCVTVTTSVIVMEVDVSCVELFRCRLTDAES
jgi:hypothetical protein